MYNFEGTFILFVKLVFMRVQNDEEFIQGFSFHHIGGIIGNS